MVYSDGFHNRAIFLDKDGTLIQDVPYNVDPQKVVFEAGVFEGLYALQEAGFRLVIISNQSGLALGKFTHDLLDDLIKYFYKTFTERGLELSGFYYCPHAPTDNSCICRKPKPGLLIQAAQELHIDLNQSWMIGDILHDVEAGNRAGCKTVLIKNGNETEWLLGEFREPHYIAPNFADAAHHMLTRTAIANA